MLIEIKEVCTDKNYLGNKLEECMDKRKAFYSEADFQLNLAMYFFKDYELYLEYPIFDNKLSGKIVYLDIVAIDKKNDKKYGIELKYKTKKIKIRDAILRKENTYKLKEQGARDLGCYYYI